ncbi:MAG: VWA domain-containing protein [Victivallales bacterium]|nr:VWA domain-containing protein [Victivallales bacterium]
MNFINIQVFWYIPLILLFMILLFWRARIRRNNIMRTVLGPRATDNKHVSMSPARRLFRFCVLLTVMLMLIVAIARPTWKLKLVPYQTRGRDLMVLFDVSKSMLAQDVKPSRLAHAKLFLRDLVEQTGSDRFGLVAFAGRAFLECPLTTDKTSFIQYIDELDTASIPLGGTNLQLALETAIKAFDAAEGNNRAIILITDGDELSGNSKLALAELKRARIPLLIVGVGSSAAPALVPVKQAKGEEVRFLRDSSGELVKTRLNVTLMQGLADATGGCFVHSTTTDFGLEDIEEGIKKLLPEELEKGEKTRPIERFYYFLAFATALLWLWMLISEHPGGRQRRRPAITALIVILLSVQIPARGQENPENREPAPVTLPDKLKSVPEKTAETQAEPVNPVSAYNQARELQVNHKGDPSQLYTAAINLAGNNLPVRSKSFNNLGVFKHQDARKGVAQAVAKVRQQQLDGAISQLESAKKILDRAEEMYIKALSTETETPPPTGNKTAEKPKSGKPQAQKAELSEKNRNQTAVNQQLLLNDRVMIDELIKKIKELKKQQQKAQKQTRQAQKQQQQQNQQKKQDQNQRQKQNQQQKQDQQKKQDQKQRQKQNQQQQKQDQQKKQDQNQQQKQDQQKPQPDELKKAQNEVKKLQDQAKELGQKKLEDQAQRAGKELDQAEKSRRKAKGSEAEEHIKKALKELNPANGKDQRKKQDRKQRKKSGKGRKEEDKKQKDKGRGKGKQDNKLPEPQAQAAEAAKTEKAPKDMNPKEARQLLKLMTDKEKDFRKALKAMRREQYKNVQVEKDW